MRLRPAIIIIENNHILLMKYQYGEEQIYNFPGGNLEDEELLPIALERECKEELGIDVEVGKMLFLGQMAGNEFRKAALHVFFEGFIIGGVPILQANETTAAEVVWLPLAELSVVNLYPNAGDALQDYLITGKSGKYLGLIEQRWIG